VRLALAHRQHEPQHGADDTSPDIRSALLACSLCGATDCLELLLTESAASPHVRGGRADGPGPAMVDAADDEGITLLMLAALHAHEVITRAPSPRDPPPSPSPPLAGRVCDTAHSTHGECRARGSHGMAAEPNGR
jgi:hypothetical protein